MVCIQEQKTTIYIMDEEVSLCKIQLEMSGFKKKPIILFYLIICSLFYLLTLQLIVIKHINVNGKQYGF